MSSVLDHESVSAETCPRCRTNQPWGEASWCPGCGYYPAVDGKSVDGASWADDLPDAPEAVVEDDRSALESIPAWFWVMIAGIVGIVAFSVAVRVTFPDDEGPRGLIALAQLCTGFGSMLISHIIAAKLAMSTDRRVNFNDVLLSWFNVWHPTIAQLPSTCKRLLAMIWGMIAVLTAVTMIGGIDYGAPFRGHDAPELKPMSVIGTVAGAAAAQAKAQGKQDVSLGKALGDLQGQVADAQGQNGMLAGGDPQMSMEDALNELGDVEGELKGMSDALGDAADLALNGGLTDEEKNAIRTLECFIYGVVTDSKNIPTGFLFAANTRGDDQHVAEIDAKDLPKDVFRKIAVRLYKETQKEPEINSDRKAIWVKPVVSCRLGFRGYLENGELNEPKFDAMIVKQPGLYNQTRLRRPSTTGQNDTGTVRQ